MQSKFTAVSHTTAQTEVLKYSLVITILQDAMHLTVYMVQLTLAYGDFSPIYYGHKSMALRVKLAAYPC